jgi:phosphoserine phosphatase RsbU/P
MVDFHLEVSDAQGQRVIIIDKPHLTLGRRVESDVRVTGDDVSRDHAEIREQAAGEYVVRDRGSRFGTFVNGERKSEHVLADGDVVRLGPSGAVEIRFVAPAGTASRSTTEMIGGLRHIASLLDALRGLGSGRVLDEVLALVIDSAIEVSGAERGFIMLEGPSGDLEFKLGRATGRKTLPGTRFETSRKIPEEVFATGEPRHERDLHVPNLADAHKGTIVIGIRHVFCVPLRLVQYVDRAEAAVPEKRIGVLYLDGSVKGALLSSSARAAVETLANEAAIAIENARLYRQALEKTRLEQELKIAAAIQQTLLPQTRQKGGHFDAVGSMVPCRQIGGDFFDYAEGPQGQLCFAVADVTGKGAPAALLAAVLQGSFAAYSGMGASPAQAAVGLNYVLQRRPVESRFATMVCGTLSRDGTLSYCNAGHNPPLLVRRTGEVRRLETGGLILGIFPDAQYDQEEIVLAPGDTLVLFSDGVSEALDAEGREFGEQGILDAARAHAAADTAELLGELVAAVRRFSAEAAQHDDLTLLLVRYNGDTAHG